MVRVVIIAVLVCLQAFVGVPEFFYGTDGPLSPLSPEDFYGDGYWMRALTYSFFHANWWHLAINCLAAWTIFDPKRKFSWLQLVTGYAIAVLVYPLSLNPVIGFSNVLYAVLGLRTPSLRSRWWRQPVVIVFLAVTFAMLLIPRFSATTHIAAFAAGMPCASIRRGYLRLTEDARRYL